jgi:hypothetical protein
MSDKTRWQPVETALSGKWVTARNANGRRFAAIRAPYPGMSVSVWLDNEGLLRDPIEWMEATEAPL